MDIKLNEIVGGGYNKFFNNKNFYRVVKGSRGSKKSKQLHLTLSLELCNTVGLTCLL